jgi:hypothetical protein
VTVNLKGSASVHLLYERTWHGDQRPCGPARHAGQADHGAQLRGRFDRRGRRPGRPAIRDTAEARVGMGRRSLGSPRVANHQTRPARPGARHPGRGRPAARRRVPRAVHRRPARPPAGGLLRQRRRLSGPCLGVPEHGSPAVTNGQQRSSNHGPDQRRDRIIPAQGPVALPGGPASQARSEGSIPFAPSTILAGQRPEGVKLAVARGPGGADATVQAGGWVMLTIQGMPNWSTHMPNSSPHICFSNGIVTMPPPDNLSQ